MFPIFCTKHPKKGQGCLLHQPVLVHRFYQITLNCTFSQIFPLSSKCLFFCMDILMALNLQYYLALTVL